ncbi:MAG: hypothetical protein M3P45_11375 [Acidobacteriota bacterium]|nr:hypothetical protein [Acidobacteriota bacterium]
MRAHPSTSLCGFLAIVLLAQPLFAFQSPLSDESLRQAYFLGQRRDGSLERLVESYSRHFTPPKTGPYISAVILATPFLVAAQSSSAQVANYSAQQAAADHRKAGEEMVQVTVEIQLTPSYGQFLLVESAHSRSASPASLMARPGDFWKEFEVHVYNGERDLQPSAIDGHANYSCNEHGGCTLVGATLRCDFRADAFDSNTASFTVDPPEGARVTGDFDLSRLR